MYCPECRAEFREGFTECSDCQVPLVATLPPEPEPEEVDLVTVLQAGDETLLGMAEALLRDAEIEYLAKGEGVQDLFGFGRLGTGFNVFAGPVELQVDQKDAEEARAILAEINRPSAPDSETEAEAEEEEQGEPGEDEEEEQE